MSTGQSQPAPGGERIVQRGYYLDELTAGTVFEHRPGRTVTEADNVLFSSLTMNANAVHMDAAWCAGTEFGERLMNSIFTLGILVGMSSTHLTQGTIVANLGFDAVEYPAPLYAGDTLYGETRIVEARASRSRPGQGIVTFEHTGRNQEGTVVCRAVRKVLLRASDHRQEQS